MIESCKLHNYKLKIVICILFLFVLLPNQLCQAKQKENNNIVLSHSGTNYEMKLYYTDISLLNFYFLYYYCLDSHIITSCFEDPQTIINEIKKAYNLYYSSDISYIGGAFKTGLHNILEAAVYGKPLFFGPHFEHFNEAVELVSLKGAFSINSSEEMYDIVKDFENDSKEYQKTCEICENYVNRNLGTANKIFEHIKSQIK